MGGYFLLNKDPIMNKKLFYRIIKHLLLIIIGIIMIIPFLWMISSSLKTQYDVMKIPPVWIPDPLIWWNYVEIFVERPLALFILNSFKVTILAVLGQLFFSSLAGYAFAKIRFKGRDIIFFAYLGTLMIPIQVRIIPLFLLITRIGWIDTHWPLILPAFFTPFGVFLMKQFFMTIPNELGESAEMDGCNQFVIFSRIMLPLVKPALAVLGIFGFMGSWNDLLSPLIFLNNVNKFTLTLGLAYFKGLYISRWNLIMAGSVVSIIPILVLYLFSQKYFEKGIVMSGIKG